MVDKVQDPKKDDLRRKYSVAVGRLLAPVMDPLLARQGAMLAQIVPHWPALCPMFAAYSVPEKVRGRTLTVAVASDSVKQEMHYISPQIVEGINTLLGYSALEKVQCITLQTGMWAKPLAPVKALRKEQPMVPDDKLKGLCESVGDEGIRHALLKLGATLNKDKSKGKKG